MVTPTSSLQTLANDEAIAFVTSLQKVKDHLSQSLQWMSEQVQQKTAQLQGIVALLSEAEALGLLSADTDSIPEETAAAPFALFATTNGATYESALAISGTANGSASPAEATEPVTTAIAALPVKKPATQPRDQQGKADAAKAPGGSKPSAITQPSTAKATPLKPSTLPTSKANQRGKASGFQQFLKGQFRAQTLTESVSDILNRAAAPLSTDEVMAALYDGLPKADYNRVKHSLANILSVGRSQGAWKSTGRGRYAGNTFANI